MYQSPFRFIRAEALATDEPEALRRALALEKKKLLAEFELAGASAIVLDGRELHRQDVLRIFDELGDGQRLRYHRAIAGDDALRSFLEGVAVQKAGRWQNNALYEDAGFLRFVSPYFAEATNALLQSILTGKTPASALDTLSQNTALREPADTETAYRYATRFFTEKKNELLALRQRADSGQEVMIPEIGNWCGDAGVQVLNRLPDSFSALRYVLANTLNNLCVAYDRLKKPRLSLAAIEAAAKIRTEDEELKRLIPANLKIIRRKAARGWWNFDPKTGRRKPKLSLIIALIIIIIRIVSGFNSCNDGSKHYQGISNLPAINIPESKAPALSFNSLLKALEKGTTASKEDSFLSIADVVRLRQPELSGDDVFKPLFGSDTLLAMTSAGITPSDSFSVLLHNESEWEVIVLYCVAKQFYASAYIPPRSEYRLGYMLPDIALGFYAGHDWNKQLMSAYDQYLTPYYERRRVYRGGFRERAVWPTEDTTGTPLLERSGQIPGNAPDTVTITNSAAHGGVEVSIGLAD